MFGRPTIFSRGAGFFALLGLIFLIAFVSLWVQIDGLIGSSGVSPVADFFRRRASNW